MQGGVACAVFKVDPRAKVGVRWRPGVAAANVASSGFPLSPGSAFSVAGEGLIRNSQFVMDGAPIVEQVKVYAIYFDRVDVVVSEFAEHVSRATELGLARIGDVLGEVLLELRKHTDALQEGADRELEPIS